MKDYWLKAEFFKRKIQGYAGAGDSELVVYWEYSNAIFVPKGTFKYYRRLQKCKLLRTMYV